MAIWLYFMHQTKAHNKHNADQLIRDQRLLWELKIDRLNMFNNNNNSHDNVCGAVIMTKVIARVHQFHLINVDWVPGGRQPSDQASQLGM